MKFKIITTERILLPENPKIINISSLEFGNPYWI
jgi:hypothetical protein